MINIDLSPIYVLSNLTSQHISVHILSGESQKSEQSNVSNKNSLNRHLAKSSRNKLLLHPGEFYPVMSLAPVENNRLLLRGADGEFYLYIVLIC